LLRKADQGPTYVDGTSATLVTSDGPGMQTLDLALVRLAAVRELARIEVRGEAFNALNHSNLGTITEASTPGRELQVSARFSF
jgi:hypothetical protein